MNSVLPQRYVERMHGVLSCYDRILIMGCQGCVAPKV